MTKKIKVLLFLHANGYVPEAYDDFLNFFRKDYWILSPNLYPLKVSHRYSHWKDLILPLKNKIFEIIEMEKKINQKIELLLVGHSMGAVLALFLADDIKKNPSSWNDVFDLKKMILIEPVFLTPILFRLLHWIPLNLRMRLIPVAKVALGRKNGWKNFDEAFVYFRSKKVFSSFSEDRLKILLSSILEEEQKGKKKKSYYLKVDPQQEALGYAMVSSPWFLLMNPPCSYLLLHTEKGSVLSPFCLKWIQHLSQRSKKMQSDVKKIKKGSHLLPLEFPELCFSSIKKN